MDCKGEDLMFILTISITLFTAGILHDINQHFEEFEKRPSNLQQEMDRIAFLDKYRKL